MNENFTNSDDYMNNHDDEENKELQELLKRKMSSENSDEYENFDTSVNYASVDYNKNNDINNGDKLSDLKPKKFVITVEPKNVLYIENMELEQRTNLINALISQYRENDVVQANSIGTKKFLKHLIVVVITLIIGFPIVFFLTNASIEATTNSYREIQNNFEKLYQQQGGVKRKELNKMQNLKY